MIREWRTVTAHLLTGFLGSGKTSMLKRLLALPDLAGTAVLINEFGEVGLDHLLVEEVDEQVVLLKSGCVCCSIRGDLRDGLERLHGRMESGEVPPFERVVIETTGLADPVPIVAGFTADPALRWHFRLGNVVTVVDAVNGAANLERFPGGDEAGSVGRPAGGEQDRPRRPGPAAAAAPLAQPRGLGASLDRQRPGPGDPAARRHARRDGTRGGDGALGRRRAGAPRPSSRRAFDLLPHRRCAAGLGGIRLVAVPAAAHAWGVDPAGEGAPAGPGCRAAGRGPGRAAPGAQAAPPRRLAGRPAADPAGDHRHRPGPHRDRALVPRLLPPRAPAPALASSG